MSGQAKIREDWIDAIFRPVIGFFVGMVLGYTAQLAAVSGWWFALGFTAVISLVMFLIVMLDRFMDRSIGRFFDWTIGAKYPGGIKPSKTPHKPHWFVRYGWLPAMFLGAIAVYVLPQGVLDWL